MSNHSSEVSEREEEEERAERDLSSTVCHLCRQRKTKCDRKKPRCSFCVKAKVSCRYVERPKKRGLRAGYVSELEARIEVLESRIDDLSQLPNSIQAAEPIVGAGTPATSPRTSVAAPASFWTPSSLNQATRSGDLSDPGGAVTDLMSLPNAYFRTLADLWFKHTHTWVPILNRDQIQLSLDSLPIPCDYIADIVLRAVIALEIAHSSQALCLGYKGRHRLSRWLRSQVLVEAIANPSHSSLRALLIIALLDYGSDDIASTFSLMAMCRRIGESIGIFRSLLKRIESEAPSEVGPPASKTFSDEELSIPLTWCILALDSVSSLGASWRDVPAALTEHLSSIAFISTPDFRDSFRSHTHLCTLALQRVHEHLHSFEKAHEMSEVDSIGACEEIYQNLLSYGSLGESTYTLQPDGMIDFDPCTVFNRILSHSSIIMMYQRYVFSLDKELASLVRDRCNHSAQEIVHVIRDISDVDAEVNSPLFSTSLFVAARFRLVLSRGTTERLDASFDMLMHGINMCGRRWPYARRLDIVMRAALSEADAGTSLSLPGEFWDLSKSHLDISDASKAWVENYKPSLFVGSLNGPYA